MKPVLRPYQVEAIDCFNRARAEKKENRFLLTAAVGAGKTIISSSIISAEVRERGGRALFLCHRDELIRQTVEKLAMVDDSLKVGVVQGDRDEWEGYDVVVASVQTISGKRRMPRYPTDYFTLIIVDETHRVTANSYMKVLHHFGCFRDNGTTLLGITATSKRTDGVSLDKVYQRHVFDIGMLDLIKMGALVNIKALTVETQTDLSGVQKRMGDFAENQLASVLNTENRNQLIAQAVREHASDRKTLVFCVNVDHAIELARVMTAHGIETRAVHGRLSVDERRELLQAFSRGEISALTTVQLLVEGYDEPSVNCVVWATATMSHIKYVQGIGRGTRLSPETGKTDLLVLDCADNAGRHSLMSVPKLFGVKSDGTRALREGKSVTEAIQADEEAEKAAKEAEARRKREEEARKLVGNTLLTRRVDLFSTHANNLPDFMRKSQFSWLEIVPNKRYCVALFSKQVHIWHERGAWHVGILDAEKNYSLEKRLGNPNGMRHAFNIAEQYMNKAATWMLVKYKDWNREAPSPGQISALRKFGVEIPRTKKEAYLAISLSMTRSHFRRHRLA